MPNPSRRAVLSGAVVVTAAVIGGSAGAARHVHHRVAVPPEPAPAGLTGALARHQALESAVAAVLSGAAASGISSQQTTQLHSFQVDLASQSAALAAVLESYPGWRWSQQNPAPVPAVSATVAATAAGIRAASAAQSKTLESSCRAWPLDEAQAARVVPLLGSLCASLNVHRTLLG
jgi:hypothetical protein